MAYMKLKELTKYFDFKQEIDINNLPEYVLEYIDQGDKILLAYKTARDHAVFTDKTMVLFDRDIMGSYKKIHVVPYTSISSSAICFRPGKAELLLSLDSGYQIRLVFVNMNHNKKENLKVAYKAMMNITEKA